MSRLIKSFSLISILLGSLLATEAMAFQPFVVKRIRIQGLQRVSEAAVLNELPVHIGETLSEEEASDAIRALYQTGFFKEVTFARDGNTLVVRLVERATISKLTINGIKDKDKIIKLLREAGVAEGRMYDAAVLANAKRELEKHYFSKGKYGVRIESAVQHTKEGLLELCISIYEGDVARIKKINIIGNCVFSKSELTKDFHSNTSNWLSWFTGDDQYAKEKLNADLETLRSYYMDRGYIQMQVDSVQVSLTPNKKHIYITIHISEGEKYCFGEICLTGNVVIGREKLMPILCKLVPGKTFSRKALLDVKDALEERLGCEGYSQSEANFVPSVDEADRTVGITFDINPGKRIYVRRIQFVGNATTKDEVLRRELPQMEGTWVSTGLITNGKERIMRRGFATEIEVETVPVPGTSDQVDVVYKIEEARLGQVGAGLGYSPTEKLMFNFSLSQENFFGTGKTVGFNFDKSKAASNYAFDYLDPYFTVDGIGMGAGAYYNKTNLSKTTNISQYTTDAVGGDLRWVFPLSQYEAFSASLGVDETLLKLDQSFVAQELKDFTNKYGKRFAEVMLALIWGYDSLDQRIFPKRGLSQSLKLQVVFPGAKQQYYKTSYDIAYYYPLSDSERWIANFVGCVGFGNGYGKTPVLPFYRNYFAGGTRYVRGFEENSLGPKDSLGRSYGGNAMVAATAALIFPNPIKPDAKSIRTALFLDAGQVYDTRRPKLLGNGKPVTPYDTAIRFSVGVSLAWHSPLGAPLTFALAKPLNPKAGDERRAFTFWLGTHF